MTTEKFQLTGVFVQDPDSKGFTAFFAQLPNIIAEGDTEEDATKNLIHTVQAVFEHQKDIQVKSCTPDNTVITKPFNLSFA
jgi:predicted RNase H-like HicB family nuclease